MTPMSGEPRRMKSAATETRVTPRNMTLWMVRLTTEEARPEPRKQRAMMPKARVSPTSGVMRRLPAEPRISRISRTGRCFVNFVQFVVDAGRASFVRPPAEGRLVLAEAVGFVVEVAHVGRGLELLAH